MAACGEFLMAVDTRQGRPEGEPEGPVVRLSPATLGSDRPSGGPGCSWMVGHSGPHHCSTPPSFLRLGLFGGEDFAVLTDLDFTADLTGNAMFALR